MPEEPDYRPVVGPDPPDDLLDVGRRRSAPRWAVGVLWAAFIAVAVTVVVVRGNSSNDAGRPRPSPTSDGPQLGSLLTGDSEGDLAIDGHILYDLSQGALYRMDITDPAAPVYDGVATIAGLNRTVANVTVHLVLDPAQHHVWVITYDAAPATVIEFDSRTLIEIGRLLWPSDVHAAAVLDGHLYLAATNAVVDIASAKDEPRTIGSLTGQYGGVVADADHSRLLLLSDEQSPRVWTYSPADARSARGPVLPLSKGGLRVVGDSIWVGGFSSRGAVLARLDPKTLRPVAFSELSPQLGPGAIAVAAGQNVLWVRSGAGGDGLWCVDGVTGDQLQYWQYNGAVASTHGLGFVSVRDGPLSLQLAACPG